MGYPRVYRAVVRQLDPHPDVRRQLFIPGISIVADHRITILGAIGAGSTTVRPERPKRRAQQDRLSCEIPRLINLTNTSFSRCRDLENSDNALPDREKLLVSKEMALHALDRLRWPSALCIAIVT